MIFRGAYTALITPFTKENKIDEEALRRLVQLQIKAGIDGIVFLGTTGESPTITFEERKRILAIGAETTKGKTKMIVGCGTYSTKETIEYARDAEKQGADGLLIVSPYYNKPTQEGIFLHYKAITDATHLPIALYNIPSRTSSNMEFSTIERLAKISTIVAIKECTGTGLAQDIVEQILPQKSEFSIVTGDDCNTIPMMALGGHGVISTISNLLPKQVVKLVRCMQEGNLLEAQKIHYLLKPVVHAAFIETNPGPIKKMLEYAGLINGSLRLPLCPPISANAKKIEACLDKVQDMLSYESELQLCTR